MSQIKTKYIADNQVTNAKLAQVATQTIKGRTTSGTGNSEDLTATQATAILNPVVGDSGSGGTKGLVPAPGAGDSAAGKFLKANGTFAVPGTPDTISILQMNLGVDHLPLVEGALGTTDSQTQILLHLDNNIIDASSYARTLTQGSGTSSYVTGEFSQGLNVASGGFPQITNYPAAFNLGTGDFTIELWAKSSGINGNGFNYLASAGTFGVGQDWALHIAADGTITWDNPTLLNSSAGAFPYDSNWHHVAFVHNGSTQTIYVDGVSVGSNSSSTAIPYTGTNGLSFGDVTGDTTNLLAWNGSIDEVRISVGIARWTTGFTPPIAPYTSSQYMTFNFGSNQLQSSAAPTDNTSLTNKLYVDTAVSSINAINQLTGDVIAGPATGSQSKAATIAKIQGTTVSGTTGSTNVVFSSAPTLTNPIVGTQTSTDNSTKAASTAYVTAAINSAIAGVNPATAVQAATTQASDTSGLTYNNGVSGIGATLTGPTNTAITFDGFTFTALGQRGLVKNDTQSPSGAFNGIYYVTQLQTGILPAILTRALDYDQPSDINYTGAIPVINGTLNASTSWLLTSQVTTVGTDPLSYIKFSINPSTITIASAGDINETSFTAADNQSSATNVTSLAFANGTVRSAEIILSVVRSATYAQYKFNIVQGASSWYISQSYVGDDTGLVFTITTAGQIQYTSTSTGSTAAIRFRAFTTSV